MELHGAPPPPDLASFATYCKRDSAVAFTPNADANFEVPATLPHLHLKHGLGTVVTVLEQRRSYTAPSTRITQCFSIDVWGPDRNCVSRRRRSHALPYIAAFPWNSGSGFGAKYTQPASGIPHQTKGVNLSPTASAIAVACRGTQG